MSFSSRAYIIVLSLLLLWTSLASAQDLERRFSEWKERHDLSDESIAVSFTELSSADPIFEFRSEEMMTPASTQKLISSFLVLNTFSPEKRFSTWVGHDGEIIDSTLIGNLHVMGFGDMSLGSRYFNHDFIEEWAENLERKGIGKIQGDIICYGTWDMDSIIPSSWSEDDIGNYYGAGSHALSYNDNLFELHFRTAKVGTKAKLKYTHPIPYKVELSGEVRVENINYDNCYIYGAPYEMHRKMTGSLPPHKKDFVVKASLPNPELQLAEDLRKHFQKSGIQVSGLPRTTDQKKVQNFKLLWADEGEQLKDLAYWTNMKSINLFAEQFIMHVCQKEFNEFTYRALPHRYKELLSKAGLDSSNLILYDGSGLSRDNKLTAKTLTSLLNKAKDADFYQLYKASLPQAGRSGSLASMLKGTEAEGRVFAKSGSFKGVRSYAGYIESPEKQYSFAMIINDKGKTGYQMKKALEELMLILYEN